MRKLAWDNSFKRAFKKHTKNNQKLRELIFTTLDELAKDPFQAKVKTHKLSGQLKGLWACWVEYDCRIIFTFEYDTETNEEFIVLIDIGTHDELY